MLSVVIPAYNEADDIESSVAAVSRQLKVLGRYEIIVAEDGSTDGTDRIARRLARTRNHVRSIHSRLKLGRGLALRKAFAFSKGSTIGYIDADLSPNPRHLKGMMKYSKDYDIVIGSRYVAGASVKRPLLRDIVSRSYNRLLRTGFGCNIYDFQCGLKIFSRAFFEKEIKRIKEKSWAWDTVVLIEAAKKGYKIKEIPIDWKEKRESAHSASPKRLWKDFLIHGRVILRLFAKWKLGMKVEV